MSLDSIVSVTITQETSAVSRTGFGTPLIAGYHAHYADVVRTYDSATGLTALASDGFLVTDPIYMAAKALLAQSPKVQQFKVGKVATQSTQTIKIVPVAINSHAYDLSIGGEAMGTFTSDSSATVAEATAGLTTNINAMAGLWVATDNTTYVSVASDAANKFYVYSNYNKNDLKFTDVTATDASLATELDAIVVADDDWYCLLLASQPEANIEAAASWCETKSKIMVCSNADWGITDSGTTTDVASDLHASAYARTALIYHANIGEYAGAAWAGKLLSLDPGSETWAFKTLAGITVDTLNATQRSTIEGKKCNHYLTVAGNNITQLGVTSSGAFIDVTRFVDWLKARIQEEVFSALINNNKIPYTDAGVAVIKGLILGVLRRGIRVGGLAESPAPAVDAPLVASVSSVDKGNRLLPDVTFSATLAGAIHSITISGVVSV